jgi:hypothetical protein
MLLTQLFESLNEARLNVGDPVEITGNVEFKGTTGDVADIGRNGAFVVVDLYNHGRQSFHSSDVSYNDYADAQDEEDDWYDDQEDTLEGWSDAIVARRTGRPRTPYSVYIKGKKWKDFENDDHARAVMDKLKAKLKADGRDPSIITIAPTDIPEGYEQEVDEVMDMPPDVPPAVIAPAPDAKYIAQKPQAPRAQSDSPAPKHAKGGVYSDDETTFKVYKPEQYREEKTQTATGIQHRAEPGVYGGSERDEDPLRTLDKHRTNRIEKALGVKFDREKKYQGGVDIADRELDEVSKDTLGRYVKLAGVDVADRASSSSYKSGAAGDKYNKADSSRQEQNRERGIDRAITRLTR